MATFDTKNKVKCKQNLIYYEPNNVYDKDGNVMDNFNYPNEDLEMSVDLQVYIPENFGSFGFGAESNYGMYTLNTLVSDNTYGSERDEIKHNLFSFFKGTEIGDNVSELTTEYTNASYREIRVSGAGGRETLCISSIDISFQPNFTPMVTIKFVDVRGYGLMMPTDHQYINSQKKNAEKNTFGSFFKVLFRLPSPFYYLTVTGYYGYPVTFLLALLSFKTELDSKTGDFNVVVQFIGHMYGLYADVPFNMLLAAPYVNFGSKDGKSVWQQRLTSNDKAFTYATSTYNSGSMIQTFLKYVLNYCDISYNTQTLPDVRDADRKIDHLTKVLNYFQTVESAYREFLDNRFTNVISTRRVCYDNTTYLVAYFLLYNNELQGDSTPITDNIDTDTRKSPKQKLLDAINVINDDDELKKAYETYKTYANGGLGNLNKHEIDEIKSMTFDDTGHMLKGDEKANFFNNVVKQGNPYYVSNNGNNINNNEIKVFRYRDSGLIIHVFKNSIKHIKNEIEELTDSKDALIRKATAEALGFDPFIVNGYRMIFAHMDVFISLFEELLAKIRADRDKGERKLSYFKLNIDQTNMANIDKNNGDVSPFPAIYKKVGGRSEVVYPGSMTESNISKIPEVRFVDAFVDAIMNVNKDINAKLMEDEIQRDLSMCDDIAALNNQVGDLFNNMQDYYNQTSSVDWESSFDSPQSGNIVLYKDLLYNSEPWAWCADEHTTYEDILAYELYRIAWYGYYGYTEETVKACVEIDADECCKYFNNTVIRTNVEGAAKDFVEGKKRNSSVVGNLKGSPILKFVSDKFFTEQSLIKGTVKVIDYEYVKKNIWNSYKRVIYNSESKTFVLTENGKNKNPEKYSSRIREKLPEVLISQTTNKQLNSQVSLKACQIKYVDQTKKEMKCPVQDLVMFNVAYWYEKTKPFLEKFGNTPLKNISDLSALLPKAKYDIYDRIEKFNGAYGIYVVSVGKQTSQDGDFETFRDILTKYGLKNTLSQCNDRVFLKNLPTLPVAKYDDGQITNSDEIDIKFIPTFSVKDYAFRYFIDYDLKKFDNEKNGGLYNYIDNSHYPFIEKGSASGGVWYRLWYNLSYLKGKRQEFLNSDVLKGNGYGQAFCNDDKDPFRNKTDMKIEELTPRDIEKLKTYIDNSQYNRKRVEFFTKIIHPFVEGKGDSKYIKIHHELLKDFESTFIKHKFQ